MALPPVDMAGKNRVIQPEHLPVGLNIAILFPGLYSEAELPPGLGVRRNVVFSGSPVPSPSSALHLKTVMVSWKTMPDIIIETPSDQFQG